MTKEKRRKYDHTHNLYTTHDYIPDKKERFLAYQVSRYVRSLNGTKFIYILQGLSIKDKIFKCVEVYKSGVWSWLIAEEEDGTIRHFDFHHFIFKKAENGLNQ